VYRVFAFHPSGNPTVTDRVERVMEQGLGQPLVTYFSAQPVMAHA
jgi:hypothetical protein